ncbi:MAG: protein kinase [Methylacidiphilales bacterium]|nr:protein kinase [Candidatus Methylacidiphilales bacterium]
MNQILKILDEIARGDYDKRSIKNRIDAAIKEIPNGVTNFKQTIVEYNQKHTNTSVPQEFIDYFLERYDKSLTETLLASDSNIDNEKTIAKTTVIDAEKTVVIDTTNHDLDNTNSKDLSQDRTEIDVVADRHSITDKTLQSTGAFLTGTGYSDNFNLKGSNVSNKLDVGTVLKGRFRLESLLGVGGMGKVYKALDLIKYEAKNKQPYVAIKLLTDDFKKHANSFIILEREASKSQRLAHPNIATVYDFDREESTGTIYMTMELLSGIELKEFISTQVVPKKGLSFAEAWPIIEGLANALGYAHKNQLIHSDFKPGNAYLVENQQTKQQTVKVIDFGIARAGSASEREVTELDEIQIDSLSENTSITKLDENNQNTSTSIEEKSVDKTLFDPSSMNALTPAYASYEMHFQQNPDPADDIYALGCVCYELLLGAHPYRKKTAVYAVENNLQPPSLDRTSLTDLQKYTLEKSIALRRKNRIKSIHEFMEGIRPRPNHSLSIISVSFLSIVILAMVTRTFYAERLTKKNTNTVLAELYSDDIDLKYKALRSIKNLSTETQSINFNDEVCEYSTENKDTLKLSSEKVKEKSDGSLTLIDKLLGVGYDKYLIYTNAQKSLITFAKNESQKLFIPPESKSSKIDYESNTLRYNEAAALIDSLYYIYPDSKEVRDYRTSLCKAKNTLSLKIIDEFIKENDIDKLKKLLIIIGQLSNSSIFVPEILDRAIEVVKNKTYNNSILKIEDYIKQTKEELIKLNAINGAIQKQFDRVEKKIERINQFDEQYKIVSALQLDAILNQFKIYQGNKSYEITTTYNNQDYDLLFSPFFISEQVLGSINTKNNLSSKVIQSKATKLEQSVIGYYKTLENKNKFHSLKSTQYFISAKTLIKEMEKLLENNSLNENVNTISANTKEYYSILEKNNDLTLPNRYNEFIRNYKQLIILSNSKNQLQSLTDQVDQLLLNQFNNAVMEVDYDSALLYFIIVKDLTENSDMLSKMQSELVQLNNLLIKDQNNRITEKKILNIKRELINAINTDNIKVIEKLYKEYSKYPETPDKLMFKNSIALSYIKIAELTYKQLPDPNNVDELIKNSKLLTEVNSIVENGLLLNLNNTRLMEIHNNVMLRLEILEFIKSLQVEFKIALADKIMKSDNVSLRNSFENYVVARTIISITENNTNKNIVLAWDLRDKLYSKFPSSRPRLDKISLSQKPIPSKYASVGINLVSEGKLSKAQEYYTNATTHEPYHEDTIKLGRLIKKAITESIAYYKAYESKLSSSKPKPNDAKIELDKAIKIWSDREEYQLASKRLNKMISDLGKNSLNNNKTIERRVCFESYAGLGKDSRATCQDTLDKNNLGPLLVIIPSKNNEQPFAIGKYEVSVGDFNNYCISSNSCTANNDPTSINLPVTNKSISEIQSYLQWLSNITGYQYRLPTITEWQYASNVNGKEGNIDYNCNIKSYGATIRGYRMEAISIGKSNGWGLINYVGNADELVTNNQTFSLVGGNFKDRYEICNSMLTKPYDENTINNYTSFRVLRSLF